MADAADFFAASPRGAQRWLDAFGRSMIPVIPSGGRVLVERCDEAAVVPGDIAILSRRDGQLVAHLVVATNPLVTSSFPGAVDGPGLTVLGRALAFERLGTSVPLTGVTRAVLLAGHRALKSAPGVWLRSRVGQTGRAVKRLASFQPAEPPRVLGPDDERAVFAAVGHAGAGNALALLGPALTRREAVGDFTHGRVGAVGWGTPDGRLHFVECEPVGALRRSRLCALLLVTLRARRPSTVWKVQSEPMWNRALRDAGAEVDSTGCVLAPV